jgi:hypothetical protein
MKPMRNMKKFTEFMRKADTPMSLGAGETIP